MTPGGINSNNTSSIAVEIDLQKMLSLAGIELPQIPTSESGSLNELPNKIKLSKVKGVVVDSITNEPIVGVKVSNSFLKKDTTNKKGEFTIKHPDIEGTGLDPTKFSLKFKIKEYSPYELIPYTSVVELKPNLGIIQLQPTKSDLKKEITELLSFPESVSDEYSTQDVTFEFSIQKKLNTNIDDLKGIVIPLILGLISSYGISNVKKLSEKSEEEFEAAFEDLKDIITCPTTDEISRIIDVKNRLVKIINQTLNVINTTTNVLTTSGVVVGVADVALKILENLPLPTAVAGVGIPVNVINKIQDVIKFLSQLISKISKTNSILLSILTLLQLTLTQVLQFLNLLDNLIQYCYPDNTESQSQISEELTALTTQQTTQESPVIINVNGFEMGVETEKTEKSLKRRRAIARNKGGVVMLKGEWSFSSIDQILIDELVFFIQTENLKAD